MKKLITLFAIVALFGSCKKEPVATPETPQAQSKLFVVELQSSEPTGTFFGYTLSLNGTTVASPITVNTGDSVRVIVFNPLSNAFILKCYVDNTNVYPNSNYQYSDVTWPYIVN
jgi:hypothetical protein